MIKSSILQIKVLPSPILDVIAVTVIELGLAGFVISYKAQENLEVVPSALPPTSNPSWVFIVISSVNLEAIICL